MMRAEGLEGRIKEFISLNLEGVAYFSPDGNLSSEPSETHFLKVEGGSDPLGSIASVSFSKSKGEMGPFRDLGYFLHNDWISILYSCDLERFRRLMKHYHNDSIDTDVIHYELKVVSPTGESFTIVDEDNISSAVILVYQDKDGQKRTELHIDEYFGENPNKGKPMPPEFDIGDTSAMSDDEVAQRLLDKVLEHKDMSMGRFMEIAGESEIIKPEYQQGMSRKHLQFFLELPRMLERGLIKAPFPVTSQCTFQYSFERCFTNYDELEEDLARGAEDIDLAEIRELQAKGMSLEQIYQETKGRHGTLDLNIDTLQIFHDPEDDGINYEIEATHGKPYQVSFSMPKDELGQGKLEQFLKELGVLGD